MKHLLIILFLITPVLLFSQDKVADNKASETKVAESKDNKFDITKQPVLSVFTNLFKLKNLNFSKERRDDKGEILETQFQIENLTNTSMNLYIFVIATNEKDFVPVSSFDKPDLEDNDLLKLIQTYPDDVSNYEYLEKDPTGKEIKVYQKYPKDIKAGIDKKTGKPYELRDVITFHARHFSPYIKKYYFFNQITILIFDSDEKLIFRQNYKVKEVKR